MLFLTVTGAGQRPVNLLWPVVIIVNGQCLLALPMEHTGSHLRAGLDFACLGWLDPCLQHPWVSSTDRSGRLLRACGGTNVVRDAAAAREPAQRQLDWTYTLSLSLAAFVDLQEHSCVLHTISSLVSPILGPTMMVLAASYSS